jgi:hypothetical protein
MENFFTITQIYPDYELLRKSPLRNFHETKEDNFLNFQLHSNSSSANDSNFKEPFYSQKQKCFFNLTNFKEDFKNVKSAFSRENESTSHNTSNYNNELKEDAELVQSSKNNIVVPITRMENDLFLGKTINKVKRNKAFIRKFWTIIEDYYLLRLLLTSPYGLTSVINYLPKNRSVQSYKSRLVYFHKKLYEPIKDQIHSTIHQNLQLKKEKIKIESALVVMLNEVISKYNILSLEDFFAFESEIFLPEMFVIKKDDFVEAISIKKQVINNELTNSSNTGKVEVNNNELDNNLNIKFVKKTIKGYQVNNEENTNQTDKSENDDTEKNNQLIKFVIMLINIRRDKLKYNSELLQTQLFKIKK